jgi:carbon starvation protein
MDPLGGINSLWPLFGISNQMLAAIALCVATTIIVKHGGARYAWVTAMPLAWLLIVTSTAAWEKLFSDEFRIGFLAKARILGDQLAAGTLSPEMVEKTPQLIFNANLNAALTLFFLIVIWVMAADTARVCHRVITGKPYPPSSESPFEPTRLGPGLAAIAEPTQS